MTEEKFWSDSNTVAIMCSRGFNLTEEEYWSDFNIVAIMCSNRVWSKSDEELIDMYIHPLDNICYDV